ncbi:hypothetical protein P389DRAFT_207655 [Cystobasidium minutum MCA 4210]|uniref:uncharacterized protein n=1 Tax=Cystobasidium minutum MCA 4210 TaxID=1397322 RepID=UPI0034CD621B|eukprot:jgi/Rhomi1/207655/estExt_Genemark1.C_1_t20096
MQSTAPTFNVTMPPSAERTNIGASSFDESHQGASFSTSDARDGDLLASSADLFSFLANDSGNNGNNNATTTIQPKQEPDVVAPINANPFLETNAGEVDSSSSLKPSRPSSAGPLRHRRGQQDRQLSIISFASNNSSADAQGEATDSNADNNGTNTTAFSADQRTVKVGGHAFVIPLTSPIIPPQLQANVRMTSTGKPSHARKVPDDHVKRPRNAFILFRSYACTNKLLPPSLGITDHRQVSRIVGQLWKGLKPEEKAIWEKLAYEEKEKHKLMNPNYRYRPTYRKEVPSKRRRKKAVDEEEIEEEDRKCEVVARVLLEGREVDTEELEKEVEEQKMKDLQEGRTRTSRTRSRSRSNSKLSDSIPNHLHSEAAQAYFLGAGGRPSSAPPQGFESSPPEHQMHNGGSQPVSFYNRPKRSRTIASSSSADFSAGSYPHLVQQQGQATAPAHTETFPSTIPPSLRNASNLQHLFTGEPATAHSEPSQTPSIFNQYPSMQQSPFLSTYNGFKGGNGDVSLLSPSFSRKFSLGRWEVPHHPSAQVYNGPVSGAFGVPQPATDANAMAPMGFQQNAPPAAPVNPAGSSLASQDQANYSTVGQTIPEQPFDPAAVPPGYNFVPTYVYLSKEDAQNPQIVEHYLSQGFGVSYDA